MDKSETILSDHAQVDIQTHLSSTELLPLIHDVETLFRINPALSFTQFNTKNRQHYIIAGFNSSNQQHFQLTCRAERHAQGVTLYYEQGLKALTRIEIIASSSTENTLLRIYEDYNREPVAIRQTRLAEVDKSLIPWAHALRQFFKRWQRWGKFKWWRSAMLRLWLPMKPATRRIMFHFAWISAVEVVIFFILLVGYNDSSSP